MNELPVIQKTYDFIKWYVPILNRVPRDHRFTLGERMINNLYDFLEKLIQARYASKNEKINNLKVLNTQLDVLRYQTRLLFDFELLAPQRYQYTNQQLNDIGNDLGGWLKQQQGK